LEDEKCEVGHLKNAISNDSWMINSLLNDMILMLVFMTKISVTTNSEHECL
jgi:hypothetical protein